MTNSEIVEKYCSYEEYNKYVSKLEGISSHGIYQDDRTCTNIVSSVHIRKNDILKHFRVIKKFLKHYKTHNSCNNNSCYHYLNFWLNEEMKKLKILNDNTIGLYNTFMQSCIEEYNELVFDYLHKDKSNLLNELKNIKQLIEENGVLTIQNCNKSIPKLQPLPQKPQSLLPLSSIVPIPAVAAMVGFTPFGLLFHSLIKKKRTIVNNFEEENHEFMQFTHRNNDKSGNTSYKIAYNSADYYE
ncbi:PIR Superfamily Protein [Plasmodium ovale wallikeri]|uniref:PIR Superfamily Protein n=1 Tax=Plasmodium ovale wallikeri TaxID=864142 RepID=A0A1A9AMB0_PLAOA|nr:PIR Superfamily Protein [Plasmodium ovale wallikeri]SBT58428.1 PIR Superfamily Protein [Plasmodium ovale wallikeri]